MKTSEMAAHVRRDLLNRPDEDDLFMWPDHYYAALTKAAAFFRKQVSAHHPDLLRVVQLVTPNADGSVYALSDDHLGEIEVWSPPGPPRGYQLSNVLPDSGQRGFYFEGRNIMLTWPQVFSPGLYVRWIPATMTPLDKDNDSPLPTYCDEAICLRAAYEMAQTPGYLGDAEGFRRRAQAEWAGDPDEPSDMGVLGIISRQAATQGHQTAAGLGGSPWWQRIM